MYCHTSRRRFKQLTQALIFWSNYWRHKQEMLRRKCAEHPDYGNIHITP